jgi:hypothetical protein
MVKGRNTDRLSIRVPDSYKEFLKLYCSRTGMTITEFIRGLLDKYFQGLVSSYERNSSGKPEYGDNDLELIRYLKELPANHNPRSLVSRGSLTPVTDFSKVGRNDPCPCGSGKKYKKCHGA